MELRVPSSRLVKLPLEKLYERLPGEGTRRLRQSLESTAAGYDGDLRTPFYQEKTREEIIQELQEKVGLSPVPEHNAQDEAEKKKVGALSFMKPASERMESLLEYWSQKGSPDTTALAKAVASVKALLPEHSVASISLDEAYTLVLSTMQSLGLPWLGRDKRRLTWYKDHAARIRSPEEFFPTVWYWRGQQNGSNKASKNRDIWGYPHDETCLGQRFMTPLLRRLRLLPKGFSAWLGNDKVDVAMSRILRNYPRNMKFSMDYSGYDKTLAAFLIDEAYGCVEHWMGKDVTEIIRLVRDTTKTIGIVTPDGVLMGRNGGMPSGSVCTNLIDSIANLIAGFYVAFRNGTTLIDYEVMGDDSVFVWDTELAPEVVSDTVSELGLESNPDKQHVAIDSIHYLQRIHVASYQSDGLNVGVRSLFRSISGIVGRERNPRKEVWSKWMDSVGLISRMHQCETDPRFVPYVKYWYDSDELLSSGVDPVTIFRHAGSASVIREALGTLSYTYGSSGPEGVNEWRVTKVIRSFRR